MKRYWHSCIWGASKRHPMVGARAWKSFARDAMDRFHGNGLISDPVSKARLVMLTEMGLRRAEVAFRRLFEADVPSHQR